MHTSYHIIIILYPGLTNQKDLDSVFEEKILPKKKPPLEQIKENPNNKSNFSEKNSFVNSLEEIQFLKSYFEALRAGGPDDIQFIKKALKNDPRRMARGPMDDSRRGNLTYLNGEFPLYIACKYNHSKILRLLLKGRLYNLYP